MAGISARDVTRTQIYSSGAASPRAAYVPSNVPMLRSLVWIAALAGLGMVIVPLFVAGLPAAFP